MVFLPTPARSAIASMVAAWKPRSASRSRAARVIASWVSGAGAGRVGAANSVSLAEWDNDQYDTLRERQIS